MKGRTKEVTHKIMASIKSKDTKPELIFRNALWKRHIRYRKHVKIFGNPDIAIKKYKIVIFIDGDFWHGNNYKLRKLGTLETELEGYSVFWKEKIHKNIQRDMKVNQYFESLGWTVLRFWQSEIENDLYQCVEKTIRIIEEKKDI